MNCTGEKMGGLDVWRRVYNNKIVGQDILCDLAYYNTLSTIIDSKIMKWGYDDDLRVHVFAMSDTVTGKDETDNFIRDVFYQINRLTELEGDNKLTEQEKIYFFTENEVNDAHLVGTIDEFKVSYNKKKGLYKGQEGYVDVVKMGLLQYAHHLTSTEAKAYFTARRHSELIKTHIREATNKSRRVAKGLAQEHNINYKSPTTFLLFVQPQVINLLEEIQDGTLGRFFVYRRQCNSKFHKQIVDKINQAACCINNNNCDYKIVDVVGHFVEVIKWYHNNIRAIFSDYNKNNMLLYNYTHSKLSELDEQIYSGLDNLDKALLSGYARLATQNLHKLIKLNAISNMEITRKPKHVDNVVDIYMSSIETVKDVIKNSTHDKKIWYCIQSIFKNNSEIEAEKLYVEMTNVIGLQRNRCLSIVKDFVIQGLLSNKKVGRHSLYSLKMK